MKSTAIPVMVALHKAPKGYHLPLQSLHVLQFGPTAQLVRGSVEGNLDTSKIYCTAPVGTPRIKIGGDLVTWMKCNITFVRLIWSKSRIIG
jgi:hypothetical protein